MLVEMVMKDLVLQILVQFIPLVVVVEQWLLVETVRVQARVK
jgi:hypothetical protein|tara:strand:+ start:436 stop:561 length:126 start_codon:yes stop_codon:yes gene_type:complete